MSLVFPEVGHNMENESLVNNDINLKRTIISNQKRQGHKNKIN